MWALFGTDWIWILGPAELLTPCRDTAGFQSISKHGTERRINLLGLTCLCYSLPSRADSRNSPVLPPPPPPHAEDSWEVHQHQHTYGVCFTK